MRRSRTAGGEHTINRKARSRQGESKFFEGVGQKAERPKRLQWTNPNVLRQGRDSKPRRVFSTSAPEAVLDDARETENPEERGDGGMQNPLQQRTRPENL